MTYRINPDIKQKFVEVLATTDVPKTEYKLFVKQDPSEGGRTAMCALGLFCNKVLEMGAPDSNFYSAEDYWDAIHNEMSATLVNRISSMNDSISFPRTFAEMAEIIAGLETEDFA